MPTRHQEKDVEAQLHDQTNLLSTRQLIIVFSVIASTLLVAFIDQNGIGTSFGLGRVNRDRIEVWERNRVLWLGFKF
jgi:hypothetical protein